LPAGFTATSGVTVLGVGGRDAGLKAETSKNNSWGIILQPPMPSGWGDLSIALDRFDIQVDNGVSQVGGGALLTLCYDDPQFRTGGGFCRLVSARAPGSNALTVSNGFVNLSTDIVRGYDLSARYATEVGIGRLRVNLTATKFQQQANKLFADDPLDDFNGILTAPEWSGVLDLNYTVKSWNLYYGIDYVGKTSSYEYVGANPATTTVKRDTPSYFQHTMSVTYRDTASKWSATFGVRNLLDVEPPVVSSGSGVSRVGKSPLFSSYDYLGRRFFVNVSKTF
jgi:hypothetical protein